MGFKARRTYVLEFAAGTPLHGAVVKCKGVAGGKVAQWKSEIETTERDDMIELAAGQLQKVIVEWDLEEDDGTPIEITLGNILDLEIDQIMCLYDAWMTAVVGVKASLGKDSGNGSELPEGLITSTVVGSLNPLSLDTPSSSSEYSNDSQDTPIPVS